MNEFDLRNFLYNNTLLKEEEKEVSDKARREAEEEGYEDGYNDAVEDAKDALDKIKDESEEEKDEKKEVKEAATQSLSESFKFYYREGPRGLKQARQARELLKQKGIELGGENEYLLDFTNSEIGEEEALKLMRDNNLTRFVILREEATAPKLTKEGLKNMIREKITSILNEEDDLDENNIDPGVEPKSFLKKKPDYQMFEQEDVEVEDDENIDVDIEKDVEVDVDDKSVESDVEVKTEVPGESADTAAVLGLLTKAQERAEGMGDEVLMDQIGNTITYFTRKHVVKASE